MNRAWRSLQAGSGFSVHHRFPVIREPDASSARGTGDREVALSGRQKVSQVPEEWLKVSASGISVKTVP